MFINIPFVNWHVYQSSAVCCWTLHPGFSLLCSVRGGLSPTDCITQAPFQAWPVAGPGGRQEGRREREDGVRVNLPSLSQAAYPLWPQLLAPRLYSWQCHLVPLALEWQQLVLCCLSLEILAVSCLEPRHFPHL